MAVTTVEDVFEAVKALVAADAALAAKLAGGLHLGRVPASVTATVYGQVKVEPGEMQEVATGDYLQPHAVSLTVWDEAGAVDAGEVQRLVNAAFVIDERAVVSISGGRTVTLLGSRYAGGSLEDDDATREGQPVKVAGARFDWMIQGAK